DYYPAGYTFNATFLSSGGWTDAGHYVFMIYNSVTGCEAVQEFDIHINELPVCSILGADQVYSFSTDNVYTAPDGMALYHWTISGEGTINGSASSQYVSVNVNDVCNDTFTLTLEITDDNGCVSVCNKVITIYDDIDPSDIVVTPAAGDHCLGT